MQKLNSHRKLICRLEKKKNHPSIGNKAANIQRLARMGRRVPVTHVLIWEAYQRYLQNDLSVIDQVRAELAALDPGKCYAVRSSANIEDSFENSFAGQFKTVLNVQGPDSLMQAIWAVWGTAQTREIQEYLQKRSIAVDELRMAVILQEMVSPVFSGVAFSRNPMNGLRETVVEAVRGQGVALVQEGVTPYRWIYHNGKFTSRPDEDSVPDDLVKEVIDGCHRISAQAKRDVDLEWVYDGVDLYWVQMREITSLRSVQMYSNSISKEMIPGMIKPLIWSINIPLMQDVKVGLLTELIGPNRLSDENLLRSFYYRAYINMGIFGEAFEDMGFPAESLEMIWGIEDSGSQPSSRRMMPPGGMKLMSRSKMLRMAPRMIRFAFDKWTLPSRLPRRLGALENFYRSIDLDRVNSLNAEDLFSGIDRLYELNREAAYYDTIVPLSLYIYNTILRKQLERIGVDVTRLEMGHNSDEFRRYDPNYHLAQLHDHFRRLSPEQQEQVRNSSFMDVLEDQRQGAFRSNLIDLMHNFGHLCDNGNDFSSVPWRENADTILKLVTDFDHPTADAQAQLDGKIRFDEIHLPFFKRFILRGFYRRVRMFSLYREQISYLYTLGYGLFRVYFLALGRILS